MQIPTFAEQNPDKLPLFGLEWGNEANGNFCGLFGGVRATPNLAATERVGATFRRKNNFLFSGVTEELSATITVGCSLSYQPLTQCATRTAPLMGLCFCLTANKIFSFRGLTKKEISVIMGLRRKVWG